MAARALTRVGLPPTPHLDLPLGSRPQLVDEEGFEVDLEANSVQEDEQPAEDQEDVDMEADAEAEEVKEPLLSILDSSVLSYSLTQTRQHHLSHLLPHIFSHPPIHSHSRPRARGLPKHVFTFPTPPPPIQPLPFDEYHGPTLPGPSTPQAVDGPSPAKGDDSKDEPAKPKVKGKGKGKEDDIPAHETECIARVTLSVGPISFPGTELWIGRFVAPRIAGSKKEKREKERAERDRMRRVSLDPAAAAAKKAKLAASPRPLSTTARPPKPKTGPQVQVWRPGPSVRPEPPGLTGPSVPTGLNIRPPGAQAGPSRPPAVRPTGKPSIEPGLIQRVNQAATQHPWLSIIIHKAARNSASKEELAKLARIVARLGRGEPIGEGPNDGLSVPIVPVTAPATGPPPASAPSAPPNRPPPSNSSSLSPAPSQPVQSSPRGSESSLSEAPPEGAADSDSDEEPDMTGPKQVGGGPFVPSSTQPIEASSSSDIPSMDVDAQDPSPRGDQTGLAKTEHFPQPMGESPAVPSASASSMPLMSVASTSTSRPDLEPITAGDPISAPTSQTSYIASQPPNTLQARPEVLPSPAPSSLPQAVPKNPTVPSPGVPTPTTPTGPLPSLVSTGSRLPIPGSNRPLPPPPPSLPPPPPKRTYPLPPPFLFVAFKELPTEKFLLPLGSTSYVSRVGGDFVTAPPPAPPQPIVPPKSDPSSSSIEVKAEGPAPLEGAGKVASRTRASLGRQVKEVEEKLPTPPPEPTPPAPEKPLPIRSNLPVLVGMEPAQGTVLISTFMPLREWERPDWKAFSKRLPFENTTFDIPPKPDSSTIPPAQSNPSEGLGKSNDTEGPAATPKEPNAPVSSALPPPQSPNRSLRHPRQTSATIPSVSRAEKPILFNLGSESFLPEGPIQAVTLRLEGIDDKAWAKMKRVLDVAERTERMEFVRARPELLEKTESLSPDEVNAALQTAYQQQKRDLFEKMLQRIPPRSFLQYRLSSPRSDIVDAAADRWAPRPYPISTKPLYLTSPPPEGEEIYEEEVAPPPKKRRNEVEEEVMFEMPVSLDQLDERVELGAQKAVNRKVSKLKKPPNPNQKKYGSRSVAGKICEGCGRSDLKVWRRGPTGNGTLCNPCGAKFLDGTLGELKAPGAASLAVKGEGDGEEVADADNSELDVKPEVVDDDPDPPPKGLQDEETPRVQSDQTGGQDQIIIPPKEEGEAHLEPEGQIAAENGRDVPPQPRDDSVPVLEHEDHSMERTTKELSQEAPVASATISKLPEEDTTMQVDGGNVHPTATGGNDINPSQP